MKIIRRALAIVMGLVVGSVAFAQGDFAFPPSTLPAPLKAHVQRFVDSTQTRNYQCCPVRTYRAAPGTMKYDARSDSFFGIVGNSYFKYSAATLLPGGRPMSRITRADVGGELYLAPTASYSKDDPASGWPGVQDGQAFLKDFDFDDRGIHYIAYSVFGWGLLSDEGGGFQLKWRQTGATNPTQICPESNTGCPNASLILALRNGSDYYALVGGPGGWGVWKTTNPSAPEFLGAWTLLDSPYFTRDDSGTVVAATNGTSTVRIIPTSQIINGNFQGTSVGLGGSIYAATYDGSGFWFLPFSGSSSFYKVSPPSWTAVPYPVTGSMMPFFTATSGADYIAGTNGPIVSAVRLYKIGPSGVQEMSDLTSYASSYYGGATFVSHRGMLPIRYGSKTYLIWYATSVGDVYEVQAGDSISIARNTGAIAGNTPNPKSPNSTSGPYYGDKVRYDVTFNGTSTPPSTINWDFDYQASAPQYTATSAATGSVTHTYTGLTSSAAISAPKTVYAVAASVPTMNDSETLTLLVPKPRVLVPGSNELVESSKSVGKLLVGSSFYDASDGVVEGHVSDWTIDAAGGTSATNQSPTAPFGVGVCGDRTLTFAAKYGTYTPTPISLTYTVQSLVAGVAIGSSDASSITFTNTSKYGTGFQGLAVWTETWELLDASDQVIQSQVSNPVAIGTVSTFQVLKSAIQTGYKVRVRVEVDVDVAPNGCDAYLSDEAVMPLRKPDPDIVTTSCASPTTSSGTCTLSVSSVSLADKTGWTYQWFLDAAVSPSSTQATYSPTFGTAGTHTVRVVATNPFGTGEDSASFNVTVPPCDGAPPQGLISFSTTPLTGRNFQFDATAFSYTFQTCDQFSWNFGDGGTATGKTTTHLFAADGSYQVTLVVSNQNGSSTITKTHTVGTVVEPPPPTTCANPTNKVYVGYVGPTSGCAPGIGKPPCKTGEAVQFSVDVLPGFALASCHTYSWNFGDGTTSNARTPAKVYSSPGTRTVTLTVGNGSVTTTTSGTVKVEASTCGVGTPSALKISYTGLTSGCSPGGTIPCKEGESFRFWVSSTGYEFKGCETYDWNFGDGSGSTTKEPTYTFSNVGPYTVTASVTNTQGTGTASTTVRFFDPNVPKPVVSITPASTKAKIGTSIFFLANEQTGASNPILSRTWRVIRTTFGDEVIRTVNNEGGITHEFNEIGDYKVEFTATNAGGVSAPAYAYVSVVEVQEYSFLIPVVAHLKGANGTEWRTDLQIFNTDPLQGPIEFDFEFRGGQAGINKTFTMTSSTQIYEDFLAELSKPFPSLEDAGPVIVRARGDSPPQMWTRTYTVDASGVGSYGQLIPAISLDSAQQSEEQAVTYVIPGLEISTRFRTNIGIVNPSLQTVTIDVEAFDGSVYARRIGGFQLSVPPFGFVQIGDLKTGNPAKPGRIEDIEFGEPFSLSFKPLGTSPIVVYGSMIDQVSNDPVYISGTRNVDQQTADKKVQIVPGAGHFEQVDGTWKSDLVVYNDDLMTIQFDLTFYDQSGQKIAEALNQPLVAGAFVRVEDVLKWPSLDVDPGNAVGLIKVETKETVTRYPIVYERTYKDRGELGTFGQGIPAISPADANVSVGQPAFIAGVRSDESYYTNLGLVALGSEPSVVKVTLLHDGNGSPVGTWQYVVDGQVAGINPNASLIVTNIIRAISPLANKGTLKVEVVSGGDVWAYASVIAAADPTCGCSRPEHTFDPEYIPAVRMPTP